MNKSKEVIEQYLEEVRKAIHNIIPCDEFIASLRYELEEALEENDNLDLQTLIEEFGTPENVAKEYLESKEALNPRKIARIKKKRNIIIIVLLIALAATGWYLWDISKQQQVMATDVITIYE